MDENAVFVGGGGADHDQPQTLLLRMANRHGLIAGATGTGKTVTLQILAESLSLHGIPVFLADVKGDLSGLAKAGSAAFKLHQAFTDRATRIGMPAYAYHDTPVTFWDLYGVEGHPVRATVSDMGPLLLARLMGLSEVQEGVLNIAFRAADEEGLALLDLKDLQSLLVWMGENRGALSLRYGNVSLPSVGAIQRRLLVLENEGAAGFFGEPALDIADLMRLAPDGRGVVNILAAARLMSAPRLYATFLLWLLSELFEQLPEVGDPEQPRLVFFFDEAHLLFDDAPPALIAKIEQVARLIRSKGVGVFFVTQNPDDIPETVLGQLGNRVQHALRAFTARDQKALRRAAETYRPNPRFDIAEAIRDLGTGEAVTSFLDPRGAPGMAERTLIRPPSSQLGPITQAERTAFLAGSGLSGRYDRTIDRESAHEILARRAAQAASPVQQAGGAAAGTPSRGHPWSGEARSPARGRSRGDSVGDAFAKSLARSLGTRAGSAILRGFLGGLLRRR